MDKLNIQLIKGEKGQDIVLVLPELSLGKIAEYRGIDDSGHKYITMPIGCKFVMKAMEDAVLRSIDYEHCEDSKKLTEDIRSYMEEYAKAYMLDLIGVSQTPIIREDDGTLTGFKDDVDINIITE